MKRQVIEGTIQGNERGYGFLIPTDPELEDFFIPHSDLRGAMHKDLVLCEATYGKGERTTARVLKVIKRGVYEVVGTYSSARSGGFVTPDDSKYFTDIFVPFGKGLKAKTGDKVVCKIFAYPQGKCPEGLIKEVLGRRFSKNTEIKSLFRTYGIEETFPSKVLRLSQTLVEPTDEDLIDRIDLRNTLTMTIDGNDSKDFDDAVSIEKRKDGSYLLGVHIADVSHYVKDGSEIDIEALKRGTSVYFPEGVVPMLPERLSNDLCSLNEGIDRLTLSCMMEIDKRGLVYNYEMFTSVINSGARLTYDLVQKVIDKDKKALSKCSKVASSIFLMDELSDLLIENRERNGCVDLEVKESQIIVNQDQIEITAMPRDKAHRIIEQFMILANVCIATKMFQADIPCIYRVHDRPDEEKYSFFLSFLNGVGINAPYKETLTSKDYQHILEQSRSNPAFSVINRVMLRSMQKAKYSEKQKGHFGLGEEFYCHFTSPIRRYPDLFVHRVLKEYLKKGKDFVYKKYGSIASSIAKRSSETERNSMEFERAVDDYYKALYIGKFIGEDFDGVISSVTPFGVFVELKNGVEGLIKIESLPMGNFRFDEKRFRLSNGVHDFVLGGFVRIKVAGVDMVNKKAEFVLSEQK